MKTALVTGGGGGIGSAICMKLAQSGYQIIASYHRDEKKAQHLLNNLPGDGHRIVKASNTDPTAIAGLVSEVEKSHGKLHVLVNNAGITTPVAHDDLDGLSDVWIDQIMQTNFRGAFAMIRAFRHLLERSAGVDQSTIVINISSVAGQSGIGSNVAYCASKAAMDCMTKSLARALAPKIRVVSIAPGWVVGEYSKNMDPAYLKQQQDATPLGKLAKGEDVANMVLALCEQLTFTTGSILTVDGGRLLGK